MGERMDGAARGLPVRVQDVYAGYGKLEILHGVNLYANPGELVVIVGPNGSGKSTLLKTIFGFTKIYRGRIIVGSRDVTRVPPNKKPYLGLAYVFQTGNVFASLTVEENLKLSWLVFSVRAKRGELGKEAMRDPQRAFRKKLEEILEMFPRLRERLKQRAGTLSGGERQMLAIAKALLTEPRVLLLDEPTAALAPRVAEEVLEIVRKIADSGLTVLLVEQNAKRALEIGDRGYILVQGKVAYEGTTKEILAHPELGKLYLGLLK
ncbi:ABC transporter ATP-binding protein [Pyrolobus fumarii]|nr:ABC transporter ATP-binding protein [Pyrolobus fumarii]